MPKVANTSTPVRRELFERIVREAMEKLRWSRKRAETMANKMVRRFTPNALTQQLEVLASKGTPKVGPSPTSKKQVIKKTPPATQKPEAIASTDAPIKKKRKKKKHAQTPALTKAEIAKLPPVDPPRSKPRTQLEKLERALGPDDGKRRRGGQWLFQGGSPGLGRHR